jgi:hypothetical protein
MLQARIQLRYPNQATAVAVARAVEPDNISAPTGLTITTRRAGNVVDTEIRIDGRIATFIATIDDFLEAVSTAEKSLHIVRSK